MSKSKIMTKQASAQYVNICIEELINDGCEIITVLPYAYIYNESSKMTELRKILITFKTP